MLVGVVSDTHNRLDNVQEIVNIFNSNYVDLVIHTGDITNSHTLKSFSQLRCSLKGVFGNNDLNEPGLRETASKLGFEFKLPPLILTLEGVKLAILHEPEAIEKLIGYEKNIDLILHGHTHRYRNEVTNGIKIFNPGECAGSMKGKNAVGLINTKTLDTKRIFF